MRLFALVGIFAVAVVPAVTADALSAASVKTKTVTYSISGKDGTALLIAMNRRGPKHGFLTRAIAQTAYVVTWTLDWDEGVADCRLTKATPALSITYTYPKVRGTLSAELARRWSRFMVAVRKHEQTHGRLARQMVGAAEKSVTGLFSTHDRDCRRTQAEFEKRIAKTYARFVSRQIAFDRAQHIEGGQVEGLVTLLSKGN